ncbi:cation:dicarboxylate symporter family transporter [Pectinatus brassicae]|uniref:cation:dicarboxylate symporter family transporter n=1 Tax=Pectinatus brassicae TaxID=862415 RepID=UPI00161B27B4|nr:cation:dicarboxylase symporter family transporter [Pectinatus brassicae]
MVLFNLLTVLILFVLLFYLQRRGVSFGKRVLLALILGLVVGCVYHLIYGIHSPIVKDTLSWVNIVGSGYIRMLKLIVIPLVLVSITSSILQIKDMKTFRTKGLTIIAVLLFTTVIAAGIGAASALGYNLSAVGMSAGNAEIAAGQKFETKLDSFSAKPIQQQLIEIIPTNVFYAFTGQNSADTLSVVFIAVLIGLSILKIRQYKPQTAEFLQTVILAVQDIVMEVVEFILKITPYSILALIIKFIATSDLNSILKLVSFVAASYTAIIAMFIVHLLLLTLVKYNPISYIKEAFPVLSFAFMSRTSAGTLPLTVNALENKMGVSQGTANLAASFGISIGQNGCAGVYPAMLAVMIAPTVGIDPFTAAFLLKLVFVTALGSLGIAGVGGGATFAALVVLSTMGLPVGLVGLLIAIEPLIDMGRTALNVSDAMTTAIITEKITAK